jgi:hypothetical protein
MELRAVLMAGAPPVQNNQDREPLSHPAGAGRTNALLGEAEGAVCQAVWGNTVCDRTPLGEASGFWKVK